MLLLTKLILWFFKQMKQCLALSDLCSETERLKRYLGFTKI